MLSPNGLGLVSRSRRSGSRRAAILVLAVACLAISTSVARAEVLSVVPTGQVRRAPTSGAPLDTVPLTEAAAGPTRAKQRAVERRLRREGEEQRRLAAERKRLEKAQRRGERGEPLAINILAFGIAFAGIFIAGIPLGTAAIVVGAIGVGRAEREHRRGAWVGVLAIVVGAVAAIGAAIVVSRMEDDPWR